MSVRKLLVNLHLWAGVVAGIFLLMLGVSGSLIVFEEQIDQALNPRFYPLIQPQSQHKSLADLQAALLKAYPGYEVLGFGFPATDALAYPAVVGSPRLEKFIPVRVNQDTAEVIPPPPTSEGNHFASKVHQFHTH